MVSPTLTPGTLSLPPRERPRPPAPAVAAEEAQWIFSEEELLQTPSIVDGIPPEEERTLRRKGVNFILQVGMMLKLPQTTLSTAAVFFHRYLMRNSLKAKEGFKPLHHYQIAATALFLATKVEENCRKMKELVVACVRVALKDPNKLVDEQTKDFWRWRDTILYSEDVVLESLCFDLSVEAPYKTLYEMLKYFRMDHNKQLRDAAWAFLSDSGLTQLCLLFTSRTIAAASLYAGARMAGVELPPDEDGTPWYEVLYVKLKDVRRVCNMMADLFEQGKDGEPSVYAVLRSPENINMSFDTPRSLDHGESNIHQVELKNESESQGQTGNGVVDSNPAAEGSEVKNESQSQTVENGVAASNSVAPEGEDQNMDAPEDGSEEGELEG